MRKNRTYHLAELLYKSVKSVVSKTQGGLYIYTMQLPCICTYVWLVVTEICMVSVTSRNVPKFGTEKEQKMKTIAIANLKGGCGKSTSSVNLAYSLMSLGKKILLIDLDPQCNSTRFFTKVNGTGKTVQNVLANPKSINQCIYRTKYKNIDIIRGLAKENDTGEYQLKNAFENLKKEYDYCIIDTRPVFDCLTKNAIHVADIMLTPIKFDNYCRDNLALVENFVNEYADEKMEWKIFANMVANGKAQRDAMIDLIGKHDYPIMDTCISRSAVVDNALNLYKPVLKHRKNSNVAQDYLELAKELLEA